MYKCRATTSVCVDYPWLKPFLFSLLVLDVWGCFLNCHGWFFDFASIPELFGMGGGPRSWPLGFDSRPGAIRRGWGAPKPNKRGLGIVPSPICASDWSQKECEFVQLQVEGVLFSKSAAACIQLEPPSGFGRVIPTCYRTAVKSRRVPGFPAVLGSSDMPSALFPPPDPRATAGPPRALGPPSPSPKTIQKRSS